MRDALVLERLDGRERRERRVAVIAAAAAVQVIAPTHGRPRAQPLRPAHHLRLLVAVTVEQHRVVRAPRDFHEDDRRASGQFDHLDAQALEGTLAAPVDDELDGAGDVPVLAPGRIEHGRLRGNTDVVAEGGNDALVPDALDERQGAVEFGGHIGGW